MGYAYITTFVAFGRLMSGFSVGDWPKEDLEKRSNVGVNVCKILFLDYYLPGFALYL